ncbi:MAG: GNAT family N-acetyltransferase, partial [Thiohalomonadaceae bacterium]
MGGLNIRSMNRDEVDWAIELAAAEGWNPGLSDAEAFYTQDPEGFIVGVLDGKPIGCISAIAYEGGFGFIGFYIVEPPYRGQGYGIQLWQHAIRRLQGRTIGLDGVIDQVDNYSKSGFTLVH